MKTKLFGVGRGALVGQLKAALVAGLLTMAVLCVPVHADTFWSGSLINGQTVDFTYTGDIPTTISASISVVGGGLPFNNCNPAFNVGCNSVADYRYQAILEGADFFS